jgi:hypothetical protein
MLDSLDSLTFENQSNSSLTMPNYVTKLPFVFLYFSSLLLVHFISVKCMGNFVNKQGWINEVGRIFSRGVTWQTFLLLQVAVSFMNTSRPFFFLLFCLIPWRIVPIRQLYKSIILLIIFCFFFFFFFFFPYDHKTRSFNFYTIHHLLPLFF